MNRAEQKKSLSYACNKRKKEEIHVGRLKHWFDKDFVQQVSWSIIVFLTKGEVLLSLLENHLTKPYSQTLQTDSHISHPVSHNFKW